MSVNYGSKNLTTTGNLVNAGLKNYSLAQNALGNISGTVDINLSNGNYVTATATGNITTLTFSGQAASNASGFVLELTNGGSYTIAWPAAD